MVFGIDDLLIAAAVSGGSSFLSSMLGNNAAKKAQAQKDAIMRGFVTNVQAPQFDYRTGVLTAGNQAQRDISDEALARSLEIDRTGLGDVLGQQGSLFDNVSGLHAAGSAQKDTLDQNTLNQYTGVRQRDLALSAAEKSRQDAFQGQADTAAGLFKGQIGAPQEALDRGAALDNRNAMTDSTVTAPSDVPAYATAPPIIKAIYAAELARAVTKGKANTQAGNKVAAYGDAQTAGQRRQLSFSDALNTLDAKAKVSAAALPSALAVGDVQRTNAQDANASQSNLIHLFTDGQIDNTNNQGVAKIDASKNFYDTLSSDEGQKYDRFATGKKANTDALLGASSDYESAMQSLAQYKAGGTTATPSGLGTFLAAALPALAGSFGGRASAIRTSPITTRALSTTPIRYPTSTVRIGG